MDDLHADAAAPKVHASNRPQRGMIGRKNLKYGMKSPPTRTMYAVWASAMTYSATKGGCYNDPNGRKMCGAIEADLNVKSAWTYYDGKVELTVPVEVF